MAGGVLLLLLATSSTRPQALAAEETAAATAPAKVPTRARGKALIACTQVLKKRWTQTVEDVQEQVLKMIESNSSLNSTTAGRKIAEQQLASCIESIREDDVGEVNSNTLNVTRVKQLFGDENAQFTQEDNEYLAKALRGELYEGDAPSIMGVAVHQVPLGLQLLYIVVVGAAIFWVVMMLVSKLTQKDEDKKIKKTKSKDKPKQT